MARTINPEAVASKRKQILDAAQRLMLTKGFEQMSIQDILKDVQISSGAFHHYFDSRQALLEAFIERLKQEVEQPLLPIIHDQQRTAIEKLQGFFDTLNRLRTEHKADVIAALHVWYGDSNAVVRLKVDEAVFAQRAPLLGEIIRQGVAEGSFTTTYPDKAGEVVLSLLHGMANTHARLLLAVEQEPDEQHSVEAILATHAAYLDAIERVLGAPTHSFARASAEAVKMWVAALRGNSYSKVHDY